MTDMHPVIIAGPAGSLRVLDSLDAATSGDVASPDAVPVVLVHGMTDAAAVWDPALGHLHAARGGRRIVALDRRGHGGSNAPADGDHSVEASADDLRVVLDALGIERVALVGHSYGALVTLEAAAREPGRVERLVLADPPGDFTRLPASVQDEQLIPFQTALAADGWRETVAAGFEPALAGSATVTREGVTARLAAMQRDEILGVYRSMFAYEAVRALDTYLAAPGAQASAIVATSNAWPFSLHVLRPALATAVVPGTGHWLQLDAPAAFAAALDAALGTTPHRESAPPPG